jgi:acetyl-CoA acetyltransferase
MAKLDPSFAMMGQMGFDATALRKYTTVESIEHMHHAGNSSGIVDGAALMLVGNGEAGSKAGLKPRARIRAAAVIGSEPTIMLTGPTPACRKALAKAGMAAKDIDLWEVNEAFAVVPMKTARDLGVDLGPRQRQRRLHRHGPPAGRHRLHHPGHPARRAGAPQPVHRPGHAVRGRRHGHRDHH